MPQIGGANSGGSQRRPKIAGRPPMPVLMRVHRRYVVPKHGPDPKQFIVVQLRHRQAKTPPKRPPPASGRAMRRRVYLPTLKTGPATTKHRQSRLKMPPPSPGRKRRGRVPNIGTAGTAALRFRVDRKLAAKLPPPAYARSRRRRVSRVTTGQLQPRHRVLRAVKVPPPAAGRVRRRRVPDIGSAQLPIVRGHRVRLPKGLPPASGRRLRRRVPGLGTSGPIAAPIVRGHRVSRLPKAFPPFAGRRVRRRTPGIGQSATSFVVRRRPAPKNRTPLPVKGRVRHGKLIGLGTSQLFFRVIRRHRWLMWPLPQFISFRRRRQPQRLTLVGQAILGPYWTAAAQIFTPGTVAGDVRGQN